jgi:hypothetical protein
MKYCYLRISDSKKEIIMEKFPKIGHFIIFTIVALGIFIFISTTKNEIYKYFSFSVLLILTGIWGNIAEMVMIRIPANEKTYKYINFAIILVGVGYLCYSFYLFFST